MIQHQTQPSGTSCSQTVIAMALGIPVAQIIEQFGDQPMNWDQAAKAWVKLGVFPKQTFDANIVWQFSKRGLYTIAVPSLNIPKGWHLVLLEVGQESVTLYDPAKGREGKKFYSQEDILNGACGFSELTYLDFELLED